MVCNSCQTAGYINQDVVNYLEAGDIRAAESCAVLAREWHLKCRGGTWCDCQCFTGKALIPAPEADPAEAGDDSPAVD